jgi:hypothetical protein
MEVLMPEADLELLAAAVLLGQMLGQQNRDPTPGEVERVVKSVEMLRKELSKQREEQMGQGWIVQGAKEHAEKQKR